MEFTGSLWKHHNEWPFNCERTNEKESGPQRIILLFPILKPEKVFTETTCGSSEETKWPSQLTVINTFTFQIRMWEKTG